MSILFMAVATACKPNEASEDLNLNETEQMGDTIEIVLKVGAQSFKALLYNNPTSKSLTDQMPMTVDLEDYAGIEKIFYPPKALSKEGAPAGADPSVGDIMYYAPWGDVAIFYKDFGYANGLIPLGKMEDVAGFVKALATTSKVTLEISQ